MYSMLERKKSHVIYRLICAFVAIAFLSTVIIPPHVAEAAKKISILNLPIPGTMVPTSDIFKPAIIKGITVDAENPLKIDFIVNTGDNDLKGDVLKEESTKMIKYFLASLTTPEDQLWVNLSPYEQNKIIAEGFSDTNMGRDMLAQDYMLKQLSASMIYPEDDLGSKFWSKVHKKAQELYGTTEIPMNTFNKIWIVPQKAVVYEKDSSAYVVDSYLKVMLEEDYIALQENLGVKAYGLDGIEDNDAEVISGVSSEIVREIVIPAIEEEVNTGTTFSNLRQIYHALILASWYKDNLKNSLLGQVYVDKNKTKGIDNKDKQINQKIYEQYVESFKKGVYNYIREDFDEASQSIIPRKYFAGGMKFGVNLKRVRQDVGSLTRSQAMLAQDDSTRNVNVATVQVEVPSEEDADYVEEIAKSAVTSTDQPAEAPSVSGVVDERIELAKVVADRAEDVREEAEESQGVFARIKRRAALTKENIIGNAIFMGFHSAFIGSLFTTHQLADMTFSDVREYMFASSEVPFSIALWWFTIHTAISVHEMGHYITGIKKDALFKELLPAAKKKLAEKSLIKKGLWYLKMYALIPYGLFKGVSRNGLSYSVDGEYNNAMSAAGPRVSGIMGLIGLTLATILINIGLSMGVEAIVMLGRAFLGIGVVGSLDYFIADPGELKKYRDFVKSTKEGKAAAAARSTGERWVDRAADVKQQMLDARMVVIENEKGVVRVPWGFRNSGMGGVHTSDDFPESNISMQETMFIPLSARSVEEAQAMTYRLQDRLKKLIEAADGGRVFGRGIEGGLAPYLNPEEGDEVPEMRLWRMAAEAIEAEGLTAGVDVALALDPAASELQNEYRHDTKNPKSVGTYYFWRDKVGRKIMSRDELLALYVRAIEEYDLPIISIEDGFAEDDYEGWRMLRERLGDKIFIIGDDLSTTKDETVEENADDGLINTLLVKANQIGTVSETTSAVTTAYGKGVEAVVSHRSKQPVDRMVPELALAYEAVGIKAGGGGNAERLENFQGLADAVLDAVVKEATSNPADDMPAEARELVDQADSLINQLTITNVRAQEEPTNAGVPTIKVTVYVGIAGSAKYERLFKFTGATPLGTSAGVGEAIHLNDEVIWPGQIPNEELTRQYFVKHVSATGYEDGSYRFKDGLSQEGIDAVGNDELSELFANTLDYKGKGSKNVVKYINKELAPQFVGQKISDLGDQADVDRRLLNMELVAAKEKGLLEDDEINVRRVAIMQEKRYIGMNGILSLSLAFGRLIAGMQGKSLSEVTKAKHQEVMAKIIALNNWTELVTGSQREAIEQVASQSEVDIWEAMVQVLGQEDLKKALQEVNARKQDDQRLFDFVREHIRQYDDYLGPTATAEPAPANAAMLANINLKGVKSIKVGLVPIEDGQEGLGDGSVVRIVVSREGGREGVGLRLPNVEDLSGEPDTIQRLGESVVHRLREVLGSLHEENADDDTILSVLREFDEPFKNRAMLSEGVDMNADGTSLKGVKSINVKWSTEKIGVLLVKVVRAEGLDDIELSINVLYRVGQTYDIAYEIADDLRRTLGELEEEIASDELITTVVDRVYKGTPLDYKPDLGRAYSKATGFSHPQMVLLNEAEARFRNQVRESHTDPKNNAMLTFADDFAAVPNLYNDGKTLAYRPADQVGESRDLLIAELKKTSDVDVVRKLRFKLHELRTSAQIDQPYEDGFARGAFASIIGELDSDIEAVDSVLEAQEADANEAMLASEEWTEEDDEQLTALESYAGIRRSETMDPNDGGILIRNVAKDREYKLLRAKALKLVAEGREAEVVRFRWTRGDEEELVRIETANGIERPTTTNPGQSVQIDGESDSQTYKELRAKLVRLNASKNAAMVSAQKERAAKHGGINLNPNLIDFQIKRDGSGIPLPIDQQPVFDMKIDGFIPVIINVTPVSLPMLLGVADQEEDDNQLSKRNSSEYFEAKARFEWNGREEDSVLN